MITNNITGSIDFQAHLDISKLNKNKECWRRIAADYNKSFADMPSDLLELSSQKDGYIKGVYKHKDGFLKKIEFSVSPLGEKKLLSTQPGFASWQLKLLERTLLKYDIFASAVNDLKHIGENYSYSWLDDRIDNGNVSICRYNKKLISNKQSWREDGIELELEPFDYIKNKSKDGIDTHTRIKEIKEKITNINSEINNLEPLISRYYQSKGFSGFKEWINNKLASLLNKPTIIDMELQLDTLQDKREALMQILKDLENI